MVRRCTLQTFNFMHFRFSLENCIFPFQKSFASASVQMK